MGKQNQTHDVLRVSHSTCQEESKFWKQLACFQKEILMRLKEKECASLIRKFGCALTMGSCKPAQKMLLFFGVAWICSETWKVGITWIIPAQCSWVSVRESILLDTLLSLEGNFSGPVFSLVSQFFSWLFASQNWTKDFVGCAKQPDSKTESIPPIFHFPCVRPSPPARVQSSVGIFWSLARQREPGAWGKLHLLIGTPRGIAQINK